MTPFLPTFTGTGLRRWTFLLTLAGAFGGLALAADAPGRREWTVDGVTRTGLVYAPAAAKRQPTPVVFAFHGHGGTMQNAARSFSIHTHWPEAIVVYLQGVPTPGQLTDPEGKRAGWQARAGDHGDRDLKCFDTVLRELRSELRVDDRRIYATGHSNGGGFTYLLWAARGEIFAALAPSAAVGKFTRNDLKPKPVLHIAGQKDQLVKFAWQEAMIAVLKNVNQCGAGQPWDRDCTIYASPLGAPVVTMIHAGAHGYPPAAPPLIVKFFKQHAKP